MNIALISQEYPPETAHGGIGSQTYDKAHGLAALGHAVHVISHSIDRARHESLDGPVHVTRIPGCERRLPIQTEIARWLTYSAEIACAIAELHARTPLDLVDFPDWASEGYIHLLNRTPSDFPAVLQLHGPLVMFAHALGWPERDSALYRAGTAMEETCLRLADAVYSSSRCSLAWCAEHYGLPAAGVPILHTGVDTRVFHPGDARKDERPTILFVGKLERNKGVELLLDAACDVAREHPDLRLRMLGRDHGALARHLLARAQSRGLPELLELAGHIAREKLPAHLRRAHVFAAPSSYEGGPGFAYLEAMACGLPVIACAGSGASEIIRHEESGLLVPPGDREALAAALMRLLDDGELRRSMGACARSFVLSEADSELCLERLDAFYRSVVSERGSPC